MSNSATDLRHYSPDTIVALSTPPGKGALAVIRVSGEKSFEAVRAIFIPIETRNVSSVQINAERRLTSEKFREKRRHFGIITEEARIIDEVVISLFFAPHSYTGEDVVEISCHCSPFIIREIIQLLLKEARLAKPGEFTQRAFFNDLIDLTRAEAVGDLLNARTELSHRAALSQLEGSLYKKIARLLEELTSYRIELELEIDFSEQELPEIDLENLKSKLQNLQEELKLLLTTGKEGLIIREGLRVCLIGAPNVGKSSLFNALLATERAIVTAVPGTTRDYLEESLSINGYLVKLYDTAGLRATEEEVESMGISRTRKLMEQAERILYLEDGAQPMGEYAREGLNEEDRRIIKVLNKADIQPKEKIDGYRERGFIICSAKSGAGIEELQREITGNLELDSETIASGILSNMRQIEAVEKSIAGIDKGLRALDEDLGYEFIAFDLKEASEALEEIIGKITTDDILNRIFANFCIGK